MKKILQILLLLLIAKIAIAQAPQGIPYQAAARNSSGAVLASTNISVRFTIRDSIATGAIKYRETHSVTTTAQGMFSVNVGQGTVVSGTFAGINWATNAKFMQMEMDPAGGSSYIDMGTSQMMSVPYAKYAERSGNGFTHYVGEVWGGGVVYHVYRGDDGLEHGLIVALTNQSSLAAWSNVTHPIIGSSAQSDFNGLSNTNAIISQAGHTNSAAKLCADLVSGGYDDWYLPAISELRLLYNNLFNVDKSLSTISGATLLFQHLIPDITGSKPYWSSTESNFSAGSGWYFYFSNGVADFFPIGSSSYGYSNKNLSFIVRAIRSF